MNIEPGLRTDLSNDEYHGLTEWLSSSQLKAALPEHYTKPAGDSPALAFGTFFHSLVLEPDTVSDLYVPLDAEKIGVKADGSPAQNPTMTTAWKNAVAEVEKSGLSVVSIEWWERAHIMRDAIRAHPVAREVLFSEDGISEESAFAVDTTGTKVKARFDRRTPGAMALLDLKSTAARPGTHSLTSTVISYGYDLSAAHYTTVAELLGLSVDTFTLVFVSKEAPHYVTVADLDELLIRRGKRLRQLALDRLAGVVEPYEGATDRLTLTCPLWALEEEEMEVVL